MWTPSALSLSSGSKITSECRFEMFSPYWSDACIASSDDSLVMCLAATRCKMHCHCSCRACTLHSLLDELLEYEEELKKEGIFDGMLDASKKICFEEVGPLNFLSLIVIPLLDTNQDDIVDRTELLGLQVTFF